MKRKPFLLFWCGHSWGAGSGPNRLTNATTNDSAPTDMRLVDGACRSNARYQSCPLSLFSTLAAAAAIARPP
ncbi:hypothetical protein BKA63DRAFT_133276 [Paraphoma chrysanthemicola]|nr:hypothetical protein BKA63DRAFT_133276 [Paraphoma chrysanthemicola]